MGLIMKAIAILAILTLSMLWLSMRLITLESTDQDELFLVEEDRQSICFLLGEDKEGYRYFHLAEQHFLFDEDEQVDIVVKSCRSIGDVIHYLNQTKSETIWGTIQIVVHGNPYNGLSVPIYDEGPRATIKNLVKCLIDDSLDSLTTPSIDQLTKINFWGCGIGKNPLINVALSSFFRLKNTSSPKIYTSPHFVIFKEYRNGPPKRIKSTYWPYIFNRGYRPSDQKIASDMKAQFPDEDINWINAIGKSTNGDISKAFENSFHIPVSWTVLYPDKQSRPDISTFVKKMNWIKTQPELMDQIAELNIPIDKFTWRVDKVFHTQTDGSVEYAIKAIGMATILCVLMPE